MLWKLFIYFNFTFKGIAYHLWKSPCETCKFILPPHIFFSFSLFNNNFLIDSYVMINVAGVHRKLDMANQVKTAFWFFLVIYYFVFDHGNHARPKFSFVCTDNSFWLKQDAKKNDKFLKSSSNQQKYRPPGKSSPSKWMHYVEFLWHGPVCLF